MFKYTYIFITIFLLLISPVFAQNKLQKQADSAQAVFMSIRIEDTTHILQTGNYIINNTTSYNQKFEVLERISIMYFLANNLNKSISYAFKAKDVAEKSADPEMMAQGYGSIANLYSHLNLTEKARPYLNKAIQQIEKMPPGDKKFRLKALSYLELGNLDLNDKNFKGANNNYKQSLQQFNLVKNIDRSNYHYRRSLYNIGNSYKYLRQLDSAEIYLTKALAKKGNEETDLKYFINASLAEVYSLRGEYKRSIDTLQAVLKNPDFNIITLKTDVYLTLSRDYKYIGDNTNYTVYNEKHIALRDTVKSNELKAINTAFNVEQKDFSASIQESEKNNRWLIYSIIGVIIISLSIIIYINQKKKRERLVYQSIIKKLKTQAEILSAADENIEEDTKSIYTVPTLVEEEILAGLQKFEEAEGYRNSKLTVSMLAVNLKTNPAYLSAVIKSQKDKNFNTYINELRIRYICNKIHTHKEYEKYKISYLAEDCGFTSHSAFSTVFKKVTGISPSAFLREEESNTANQSVA